MVKIHFKHHLTTISTVRWVRHATIPSYRSGIAWQIKKPQILPSQMYRTQEMSSLGQVHSQSWERGICVVTEDVISKR